MNGKRIGVMGLGLVLAMGFAARVVGGTLDSPAAPSNAASAMYTLEDIYQYVNVGNTGAVKSVFTDPSGGPTNGTMHTLNDIMGVATNRAPVAKSSTGRVYVVGDDGNLNKGVAWPNPRFSVVGAPGTAETNQIRDNLTGLIWARNANFAAKTWQGALDYIAATNASPTLYGGTNDWRLPNINEMLSLIDVRWWSNTPYESLCFCNTAGTAMWTEGNPFTGLATTAIYWTSTKNAGASAQWMSVNGCVNTYAISEANGEWVWPVRGGQ